MFCGAGQGEGDANPLLGRGLMCALSPLPPSWLDLQLLPQTCLELPKILCVFSSLRSGWQIRVVPVPPAASTQPDTPLPPSAPQVAMGHPTPHRHQLEPPTLQAFVPFALERQQGREHFYFLCLFSSHRGSFRDSWG